MSLIIARNFKRAKAQDAAAQDAKFKVGDRVKHAKVKSPVQPIGKISEVYNDQRWVEVEWENMPYKYQTIETSNLLPANSRAGDSVSDKEREYTRLYELAQKNITFHAAKGDSAKVAEWKRKADEYKRLAQEATDAAKDSSELNNAADLRAALSKMADIAKRLTGANVSFKAGWTPEGVGEISLEFPDSESARRYNYYKLFNAWEAARGQIIPRWAVNIGGYRVPRIEGNRMTIGILHFTT